MQSAWPRLSLYLPGAQSEQVSALDLDWVPRSQAGHDVDPAKALKLPAGQGVHAVCPSTKLYLPGPHRSHETDLLFAEKVPTVHGEHTSLVVTSEVNKPAGHSMHSEAPSAGA
jgi:hypothetical protein